MKTPGPGQLALFDAATVTVADRTCAPEAPAAPEGPMIEDDHVVDLAPPLPIRTPRSARRKRTVPAWMEDGTLVISLPASCSLDEEAHWVEVMARRFERKRAAERIDLEGRARTLAAALGLPEPTSIRWVDNQLQRWGSCTPSDGSVRLSNRLVPFPDWVIDYVIVHELAHLVHGDHSKQFWHLVDRYPKAERAKGYLIAMAHTG